VEVTTGTESVHVSVVKVDEVYVLVGPTEEVEFPGTVECGMLLVLNMLDDENDDPVTGESDVVALLAVDAVPVGPTEEEFPGTV
jgi:hypothetical protein